MVNTKPDQAPTPRDFVAETFEELRAVYPEIGDRSLEELRQDRSSPLNDPDHDLAGDLYMLATLTQLASEREEREREEREQQQEKPAE